MSADNNKFERELNQLVNHYESKSLLGSLWGAFKALAQLLFMGIAMALPIAGGELLLLVNKLKQSAATRSDAGTKPNSGARPNFFDED